MSGSSVAGSEASYASGYSAFSGSGYSTDGGTPGGPRRRRSFSLHPGTGLVAPLFLSDASMLRTHRIYSEALCGRCAQARGTVTIGPSC